ncbi:MAG: DUF1684 domain-containing protein [Cyclobacteriaceae bacterium]
MKSYLSIFILLFCFIASPAQNNHKKEVKKWQKELNREYKNPDESPLTQEDLADFRKLDFYPIDNSYSIIAKLELTPDEQPFKMPTSTERLPEYVKYGIARFKLHGQELQLSVYKNIALSEIEEYKDYLFIPFTDQTNGEGSYGGGRYLDITIPDSDELMIDFNKAYNPYCAYNSRYSCPIPPRENNLQVAIKAGVKAFGDH